MMYRIEHDGSRAPYNLSGVIPPDMCQPPVEALALVRQLDHDEILTVLRIMIVWAPEAFERGLLHVSERRDTYRKPAPPVTGTAAIVKGTSIFHG
jgi:hypothetical protein